MTEKKSLNELKALIQKMNLYRNSYYNDNSSQISDKEYDELFDRLCKLEAETGIRYSNSPTQSVGYSVVSKLNKVKHNHPLLSLAKTTEIEEFVSYFNTRDLFLMAKMDGLTCSLLYENGELVRAESRGDGETGEDITHNALVFSNIPRTIQIKERVIIDGECIIDKKTFSKINEREHTEYKNPRNLVSGTVRQLDSSVVAGRNVKFYAWKLHDVGTGTPETYHEGFKLMQQLGFDVAPCAYIRSSNRNIDVSSAEETMRLLKKECDEKFLPIDGIVGAFDDVKYGLSLGSTGHHPKHSLAFKFYQQYNATTLLDIEWNTSRSGLINPVAIVDPVEIDGTTVARASLSNLSIIKELELGIGDEVTIIKANQIIPQITGNKTRSNTYEPPMECPACGKPVEIKDDTGREFLYCTNKNCPAIRLDKFVNFCSRSGLNIEGLSKERLQDLITKGYLFRLEDIYELRYYKYELEKMPGYGKRSVEQLLAAIEKSVVCGIDEFLVAIGIPGIGKAASKIIAQEIGRISEFSVENDSPPELFLKNCMKKYDWSILRDIGKATSDKINEYVKENYAELIGVASHLQVYLPESNGLTDCLDLKFCITGKLLVFKNRDELVAAIEDLGARVVSGVTSTTNYLICNNKDSGSSKLKKAARLGIAVITEREFLDKFNAKR